VPVVLPVTTRVVEPLVKVTKVATLLIMVVLTKMVVVVAAQVLLAEMHHLELVVMVAMVQHHL
jgi:hypothetical protein